MIAGCRHLLAGGGHFLAMKGTLPEQELLAVDRDCRLEAVHALDVPGLGELRHLVDMTLR
jgi:16S rRNA (guanine527-N7)-methyltransferase